MNPPSSSSSPLTLHPVGSCGVCRLSATNVAACSGCHIARYCGSDCQRADWPVHKRECKRMQDYNAEEEVRQVLGVLALGPSELLDSLAAFYKQGGPQCGLVLIHLRNAYEIRLAKRGWFRSAILQKDGAGELPSIREGKDFVLRVAVEDAGMERIVQTTVAVPFDAEERGTL